MECGKDHPFRIGCHIRQTPHDDVYESTANGTGNFFHDEWLRANKPEGDKDKSQMEPFFVPWFEIELYEKPFDSDNERDEFAAWLLRNMDNEKSDGSPDAGTYYWWLWSLGATLENIHWYINERKEVQRTCRTWQLSSLLMILKLQALWT